jgi:hypothetical protein
MESYKLILEAVGRFIKPSPKAKFQKGDKVKVSGENDQSRFIMYHGRKRLGHIGKVGTVIGYDYYPGSYSKFLIQFEDGTKEAFHSHFLLPAETTGTFEAFNKVVLLGIPPQARKLAQDYLTRLKKYGYEPANKNDLVNFKKNLMRSSVFQNNFIKGMKNATGKSKYHPNNLQINLIATMRIYPTAPSYIRAGYDSEDCAPAFDKNNPVFYFWYTSVRAQIEGSFNEGLIISLPEVVNYDMEVGGNPKLQIIDQSFTDVGSLKGTEIGNVLDGVEMRLMKNKKLSGSFYHEAAAHSLFRIAKLASIKDVKGVSQDDFDALIGL